MTVVDIEKYMTCYALAKLLNVSPNAVYHWKKRGSIPALRIYQLKEMKPEWFEENA
jgi:predicted transcriptional regulator